MKTFNKLQLISLDVVSVMSGSISFIGSTTIIIMILRSNLKLSTTYRRLIFLISIFDILSSIGHIMAPWGVIEDETVCTIQGFLVTVGICGSTFYSLSMSIYFLLVIKYNLKDAFISRRVEPFLHTVPVLYSLTNGIYLVATQNFNPSGPICFIESRPLNCFDDPDVDCISKGKPQILKIIAYVIPVFIAFLFNCIILLTIYQAVYSQSKQLTQLYSRTCQQHQSLASHIGQREGEEDEEEQDMEVKGCSKIYKCCLPNSTPPVQMGPLAARLSQPSQAMIQRLKEISNRLTAYAIGFLMTYVFPIIYRFWEHYGSDEAGEPFVIVFLARFFVPLQGFFNIFIYTHPHVISFRRRNNECSWIRAFWEVIITGGDSDQISITRRVNRNWSVRRRSLRNEPAVLDVSEIVGCQ
jgi:hypothetical protein